MTAHNDESENIIQILINTFSFLKSESFAMGVSVGVGAFDHHGFANPNRTSFARADLSLSGHDGQVVPWLGG